ncbi:metallothiol transferase FosB [Heyndrickxia acidicola]|uniref:Metallothiol transferase FosB n=1 Tax=Heyndrickxia acidicola TaxID=209389 RepID=A0ABU6MNI1_9BACI|nr:metallothiol transferase FosB [Heyndrickxia acidicola]MED1204585.1 metallothiol transferase FosB [Heyndrickxia acidicola]
MDWKGSINHLLFSVSDLERSIAFYKNVFNAKLLVKGRSTAYFDMHGLWLALNEEKEIPRKEINHSYTHIAFDLKEEDHDEMVKKLVSLKVTILKGRERDVLDRKSIYFTDPDGHKFEFHTGSLNERMEYYKQKKPHMKFYE